MFAASCFYEAEQHKADPERKKKERVRGKGMYYASRVCVAVSAVVFLFGVATLCCSILRAAPVAAGFKSSTWRLIKSSTRGKGNDVGPFCKDGQTGRFDLRVRTISSSRGTAFPFASRGGEGPHSIGALSDTSAHRTARMFVAEKGCCLAAEARAG